MLKDSEGFISVDSCLNHFSASTEKSGVVIWGPTRWTQFGYSHNKNLHFHMKHKWDESKFNESDPRNIMVDPEVVFNAYENRDKLNKNQTKSVYCASE
jgi:ADP-heptose:LPS heptosyltransferase